MAELHTLLSAVFSAVPYGGNIGGVVYEDQPLTPDIRQRIAADLAAPTTGFIYPNGQRSFRAHFHSSRSEMGMCGHVTVALFSAMYTDGRISSGQYDQHTDAGIIPVEIGTDGKVWMTQPSPRFDTLVLSAAEIAPLIGIGDAGILSVHSSATALQHVFVELKNEASLAALRPQDSALRALSIAKGIDTIGVWCWQYGVRGNIHVRLRDLCYGVGDAEEAASGTTNAALACHLYRLGRASVGTDARIYMIGEQGFEMGRPSKIETVLTERNGSLLSVRVGGEAQVRMKGTYFLA